MTIEDECIEEVQEALGHLTHRAKRCFPRVGSDERPTDWDVAHGRINHMLDVMELVPA
jgi:hypothetical protein